MAEIEIHHSYSVINPRRTSMYNHAHTSFALEDHYKRAQARNKRRNRS